MEKKSQEWIEKFRIAIGEKYKYLLMSELKKNYEIFDCKCDEVVLDEDDELQELSLDIHLDYMGSCDGDAHSIGWMINKINDELRDFLYIYTLDSKTFKFSKNNPATMLTDGFFYEITYKVDEKHEAKVNYKYEYPQL